MDLTVAFADSLAYEGRHIRQSAISKIDTKVRNTYSSVPRRLEHVCGSGRHIGHLVFKAFQDVSGG